MSELSLVKKIPSTTVENSVLDPDLSFTVYSDKNNQFFFEYREDIFPIDKLLLVGAKNYIPIPHILEAAKLCSINEDTIEHNTHYHVEYLLFSRLNQFSALQIKQFFQEILSLQTNILESELYCFLEAVTKSPFFNFEYRNILLELADTTKSNYEYKIYRAIVDTIVNSPLTSKSDFDLMFEKYFKTIQRIDLKHGSFIASLLKSPFLSKQQFDMIFDKLPFIDDFMVIDLVLSHPYLSTEQIDELIENDNFFTYHISLYCPFLTDNQLVKVYERSKETIYSIKNQEEFLIWYHCLNRKEIPDNYVEHENPTIRFHAACSSHLNPKQIEKLLLDDNVAVLNTLLRSSFLSEEQLDALINHVETTFDNEDKKRLYYRLAKSPFLSEEQLWKFVLMDYPEANMGAAQSSKINAQQLDVLVRSKNTNVRVCVARSMNLEKYSSDPLKPSHLSALMNSNDEDILNALAFSPIVDVENLHMINDKLLKLHTNRNGAEFMLKKHRIIEKLKQILN